MKVFPIQAILFLFAILVGSEPLWADEFVTKRKVQAFAFPEKNAQVLFEVEQGIQITVEKEASPWSLIIAKDPKTNKSHKGWVETRHLGAMESKRSGGSEDGDLAMNHSRGFYFPTALPVPKKSLIVKGFYLGVWNLEYAVTDEVNAGVNTLLPIGFFGLGGTVKFRKSVDSHLHIGAHAEFGAITATWNFFGKRASGYYYLAGGMFTFGSEKGSVSLVPSVFGVGNSGSSFAYFILNMTGAYSISQMVKMIVEVTLPVAGSGGSLIDKFALIGYGVRIGAQHVSGDIGFAIPVYDGTGGFLKYMPLGIPFISLTLAF